MNREDVEALRARVLREADNAAGRGVRLEDMTFSVEGDTLVALCRRWLAVEDAVVVCAGKSALMGEGWQIYGTDGDSVASLPIESGQRVRIVPEAGQGVA